MSIRHYHSVVCCFIAVAVSSALNIKGAFWHIVQTSVGRLNIIVSALVVRVGFLVIDPLLGMAFGVVSFWASWDIIRSALHPAAEAALRAGPQ